MNPMKSHLPILASIPDINSNADESQAEEETGWLPTSAGRLIQQAMSFKLLVGTALFLLVVAVVPLITGRTPAVATDPATVADQSPRWHGGSTTASADATTPKETVPKPAVAVKPATVVPATPESARPPAVVSSPPPTKAPQQPARVAERPLMSTWPKPSTK